MFERFTDRARRVVVLAQEESRLLGHNYIGTEHLLLGLLHEGEGVGARTLQQLGVSLPAARQEVELIIGKGGSVPAGHIPFTPRAKKVLELSLRASLQLGHNYIGTEHVLLGLLREGTGVAAQILDRMGVSVHAARTTVIDILSRHETGQGPVRPAGQLDVSRFSPGLVSVLEAAMGRAAGDPAVGTHHVLSIMAEWPDVAGHEVLVAGGFDASRLEAAIERWDVAGTRDETEDEWGRRVVELGTDAEGVVVRLRDPVLRVRVAEALAGGADDLLKAAFGRVMREIELQLPTNPTERTDDADDGDEGDDRDDGDDGPS